MESDTMKNRFLVLVAVCINLSIAGSVCGQGLVDSSVDLKVKLNATVSSWHGFDRYKFKFDNYDCFITAPSKPLASRPWVWRAKFPSYHDEVDIILVKKGFHIAYINVGAMLGSPKARAIWDGFYEYVTDKAELSEVVALEAVSRGGLFAYGWAAENAEKVACIYADTPVLDFKSWPGGKGSGIGGSSDWQNLLKQYGMTEAEAMASKDIPLEKLAPLAKANIPILHVVSSNDKVVPPSENTFILEKKYRALGGRVTVLVSDNGTAQSSGHHFPLDDPGRYANFILENTHLPAVSDGRQWYKIRSGLRNSLIRFSREKVGRVAFLGGSITQNPGWQWMVARDLQERFPDTKFEFINAGISSTGSTPGAFRFENDVLSKGRIDLLFEEAAINDRHNSRTGVEQLRAMEGIVRHGRVANAKMDIIQLHFAEEGHKADYSKAALPETVGNHETVARHYAVPSINLSREVYDRIGEGQFEWKRDFVDLHPSPFGQRLYYWSIKRLFDEAFGDGVKADEKMVDHDLPHMLDEQCYSGGKFVDFKKAKVIKGFRVDPKCRPSNGVGFRGGFVDVPMLVADSVGDSFELEFSGRGVGLFVISGPDAGIVEYSIDGGVVQRMDMFTGWGRGLNIPWLHVLDAELKPGKHKMKLSVADEKNAGSKGHAVRIRNIVVNE
jgi:sialidase-1